MRRIDQIQTLGTMLICATLLLSTTSSLVAKDPAGVRPTFNYGDQKWKHIPDGVNQAGRSSISFSNPFQGRSISMPSLKMPKLPSIKPFGSGESTILPPKVITQDDNRSYLSRTGPVNLQFNGNLPPDFDRNEIIYVEHKGQFPKEPTPPPPTKTLRAPEAKPLPLPPPTQGIGETSQPIQISTKPMGLPELLNAAPGYQFPQQGGIIFNKKIDGVAPDSQEIYTPFVVPYNATPPAVSIKGRATYIRE